MENREDGLVSRKPRVALMGEFSAGKSTLSNLLLGGNTLPVQVTATQLPPVWITQGRHSPYRVSVSGEHIPIDLAGLGSVDVESTHYIRLFHEAELLEMCDLIDMPGISDPNMSSEVWERMLTSIDLVIWCSHATQAWRQSEAAVWSMMPPALHQKSVLLLTRIDKITSDRDRERLIRRVTRETQGLFGAIFPVSLLRALSAGDDREVWESTGASAFVQHLVGTLMSYQSRDDRARLARTGGAVPGATPHVTPRRMVAAAPNRRRVGHVEPEPSQH